MGAGLEPARDFSRWFSKPVPYHSEQPTNDTVSPGGIEPLSRASEALALSIKLRGQSIFQQLNKYLIFFLFHFLRRQFFLS